MLEVVCEGRRGTTHPLRTAQASSIVSRATRSFSRGVTKSERKSHFPFGRFMYWRNHSAQQHPHAAQGALPKGGSLL
jgi:hypothetical protein